MSKILFIGGPADKQYHEVLDGKEYHTIPMVAPLAPTLELNARRPVRPRHINMVVYKRQRFVASTSIQNRDDREVREFEYFAPQNLSPADVVALLLESYSWGIVEEDEDENLIEEPRIEFENGSTFQFFDSDLHRVSPFEESGSATPSFTASEEPSESLSFSPSPSISPSAEPSEEIPFKQQMKIVARELQNFGFTVFEATRALTLLGQVLRRRSDE